MKTLKDYELQRGDWVKLATDNWREFRVWQCGRYEFYDYGLRIDGDLPALAVLRPNVIIRDSLENALKDLKQDNHISPYSQPYLVYDIIHPKEEKKSLFDEIFKGRYRTDFSEDLKKFIKPICDEIDKLKNKENEG